MIKRTGSYELYSLFDHFDVHYGASIVADGHTKVHGYSVVITRLEHRDTAGWSDRQVDIGPIQLRNKHDNS